MIFLEHFPGITGSVRPDRHSKLITRGKIAINFNCSKLYCKPSSTETHPLDQFLERRLFAIHQETDTEDLSRHPDEEYRKAKVDHISQQNLPEWGIKWDPYEHKHWAEEGHERAPEGERTVGVLE